MSKGFEQAGFTHEALIEIDKKCIETLKKNGFQTIYHESVETFDFSKFRGVDLVCGGVVCIPFSVAGLHGGEHDPRNMWPHAIRAVRETMPKAFFFENSSNMASKRHCEYLERIVGEFEEMGYSVCKNLVNAADYGVPMYRKRLLLIGVLSGSYKPPLPEFPHITVRQALLPLGPPNGHNSHTLHTAQTKPCRGHTGSILDKPSKSLVSGSHGVGGGNNALTLDDGSFRYYTPREASCLMTLPPNFQLPSKFSPAMKQLGNACPVEFVKRFALKLLPHLQ